MSKTIIPRFGHVETDLLMEPKLTFQDLKVYVAVSSFHRLLMPTPDQIMGLTGLSEDAVLKAIQHLEKIGWPVL